MRNLCKKQLKSCHLLLLVSLMSTSVAAQVYNKSNYSPTYAEIVEFYTALAKKYPQASLTTHGNTDIGKPLHLFGITGNRRQSLTTKARLLINNGIHPGEPDGINACMQLADEILGNWKNYEALFDSVELYIIPVYNVDGCLRRNSTSRANQNGPAEYGFRGNYQNLDLNRDFIKMDSQNAFAFASIFHTVNPHILVDTHVSNGADYQYTFTYFFTHPVNLGGEMAGLRNAIEKSFCADMTQRGFEPVPYVNHHSDTPMNGIEAFYDSPRYCTGYAALFGCIGITTETHMLKPFDDRVKSTYAALHSLLKLGARNRAALAAHKTPVKTKTMAVRFAADTSTFSNIPFKGYEATYQKSEVTGMDQLYYNRAKPVTKTIKYYHALQPVSEVNVPDAYIIPQSWHKVIERLRCNDIEMQQLDKDTVIKVAYYLAEKADAGSAPYEGHYYHRNVETKPVNGRRQFYQGDWVMLCNPGQYRFLVMALEPMAEDSYFRWNFFDACLQQKEWFSDYVFDKQAQELLNQNPELKTRFNAKKAEDAAFASDKFAQLYFVYKNSPFYEQTAYEIPVYRFFR